MSFNYPVVSMRTLKLLFPQHELEADEVATNGLWFYSVPDEQYLSFVPNVDVCVNDVEPAEIVFSPTTVSFSLRDYSSVYEVSVENQFPSSVFLASNFRELAEEHIDVTDNLFAAVMSNIRTPIMLGSEKVLTRLLFPSDEGSYKLQPVKDFLLERS